MNRVLRDAFGVEAPLCAWGGHPLCVRVSAHAYSTRAEYVRLADAVLTLARDTRPGALARWLAGRGR